MIFFETSTKSVVCWRIPVKIFQLRKQFYKYLIFRMDWRVLFQDFWVLFRLICILAEDLSLFYKYYSRKIYLLQFMYTLKT